MKKQVIVISLGGSQILKDRKVNVSFLKKFRKIIKKNSKRYRFVIVCGGGSVARTYIQGLKEINASEKFQNFAGISATRMNARFMSYFFAINPEKGIPHKMKEVKKRIRKQNIVFCGALDYHPDQTSDSTSAQIAQIFNLNFINLTNVKGLFDKNPKENKNAKFISQISWKNFHRVACQTKFHPGQNFVLDQKASKIILENKIKTYILGNNLKNLNNLLKGKKFIGTTICD